MLSTFKPTRRWQSALCWAILSISGSVSHAALEEGHIRSLDDRAADYESGLAGSLCGHTRLINLLRMASGAQFVEDYSGHDDLARFHQAMRKLGSVAAAQTVTQRAAPEGSVASYGKW